MWVSGVATFPQGFICEINPSTTKQRTQQALQCWLGPLQSAQSMVLPPCPAMGTQGLFTAEDSWDPCCSWEGTSPGGAKTCSQLSSTPLPSTPHLCQSLVIQPVLLSLLSSRSITAYPCLPSQFSLLVCPLSAFFAISHLLPASLRLPKPQGCMS